MFFSQEQYDNTPKSYDEISANPAFAVGTPENKAVISGIDEIHTLNAGNAAKQLARQKKEQDAQVSGLQGTGPSGTFPSPRAVYKPQDAAIWYSRVGRDDDKFSQTPEEMLTNYARQRTVVDYQFKKLQPYVDAVINGQTDALGKQISGPYGINFRKEDPETWADLLSGVEINGVPAFANKAERDNFVRHATVMDRTMGTSAYHRLQLALLSKTDREGEDVYRAVMSSEGTKDSRFRFTMDDDGERKFDAYKRFYQQHLDIIHQEQGSWHMPKMIISAFGDMLQGVGNIAIPEDQISEEWRNDPAKKARVMAALSRVADAKKAGYDLSFKNAQTDEEKLIKMAGNVQEATGTPTSDLIITDPHTTAAKFVEGNMSLIKELTELNKLGAFNKESRLAPICSALDGLFLNTGMFLGMGIYSTDPTSLVNTYEKAYDLVFPQGNTPEEKAKWFKRQEMARINEAITFREDTIRWSKYGMLFRTNGGAPGESYLSDTLNSIMPFGEWFQGNSAMLKGASVLLDPFIGAGAVEATVKAYMRGFTRSAIMETLLKTTASVENIAKFGSTAPAEILPIVNNVRETLKLDARFAGKALNDMDVLEIIARGDGRVVEIGADGSKVVRELSRSELIDITNAMNEHSIRIRNYIKARAAKLAEIQARNKGSPLSAFGKWVNDSFPDEILGFEVGPRFKKIIDGFEKARLAAEKGKTSLDVTAGTLPSASTAFGVAKVGMLTAKGIGVVTGSVLLGGGNFSGKAAAYLSAIMFASDISSVASFASRFGKISAEVNYYAQNGKTLGGSVAALRIREIEAEIAQKETTFASSAKTQAEKARFDAEIQALKDDMATYSLIRGYGIEKMLLYGRSIGSDIVNHGAMNELMMMANDNANTGGFGMATFFTGVNRLVGSAYRNVWAKEYRMDQQKIEFFANIMKHDSESPMQARRLIEYYEIHRKAGHGDRFIQAYNNLCRTISPENKVTLCTPAEINANMVLLQAGDLIESTGKDPWEFRQGLMDEARLLGLTKPEEINAYVAAKTEKAVAQSNAKRILLEGSHKVEALRLKLQSKATDVEMAVQNQQAAVEILAEKFQEAGIPTTKPDGTPVSFTAEDFNSVNAFTDALRRELGIKLGSVENGKIIGLLGSDNFASKFKDVRIAFKEHAKIKTTTDVLSREFGEIHAELASATEAHQANVDTLGLSATMDYRPGQIFAYYDKVTGTHGTATVADKGMFIVSRVSKDGERRTEILLNTSELGISAMQEEFSHRLFTSVSFNNMRIVLGRSLFGEWFRNKDGKFEKNPETPGSLIVMGEDGKYDMPLLRLFAEQHASKLSPDDAQAFMLKVKKGIEVFNENPIYGQHLLMDVTNELWAKAYIQRMAQVSPAIGKTAFDPTNREGGWEGSNLIPNQGEDIGNRTAVNTAKTGVKLLSGELTLSEAATVAFKMLLGDKDESQLSVDRRYELRKMAAKIASQFAKGGSLDSYMARSMVELLTEQGVDPEFFGNGSWHDGKLFDGNGREIALPDGLKQSVDRTMYAIRRTIGNTETSLYDTVYPYDANGKPIEVLPDGSKFDHVLWAARNNKLGMLDKNNRLKPEKVVMYEASAKMDQFSKLVFEANASGEMTGFRLQKTDNGIAVGGRITQRDVAKLLKFAEQCELPKEDIAMIAMFASALADADPNNPSNPALGGKGQPNRMQVFRIDYGSMFKGSEGTTSQAKAEVGTSFRSTRDFVPISMRIEMSGLDSWGRPIFDENGNKVSRPTIMLQGIDKDAYFRRVELGWNGLLIDDSGNVPKKFSAQKIQALFNGDKRLYAEAVRLYLENISMGGEIGRNKKDTKTPPKTSIEAFAEFAVANGISPTKENAKLMAEICNLVVGIGNSNYVSTGERPVGPLSDSQVGMRKFFDSRQWNPKTAMRDSNFILMNVRLDRMFGAMPLEGKYFPWSANSWSWASVAYQPAGWKMLKPTEQQFTTSILANIKSSNPDLSKSLSGEIGAVWQHPVGYTIIKQSDGQYHVYDAQNKFVTYTESLGNAQDAAFSHAKYNPTQMNLPFDRQMASELGLVPTGMGIVGSERRGFTSRQLFFTKDNRFQLSFNRNGSGTITDMKHGTVIATNIRAIAAENGRFDLGEVQAAFKLAYDNLTLDAPVMDLNFGNRELEPGQKRAVPTEGVEGLEFIPIKVGRNVSGKMIYASTNPAYYAAKRKLVDMLGRKGAVDVITRMKAELGDDVIAKSPKAVSDWVLNFLNSKMSTDLQKAWESERSQRNIESTRLGEDIEQRAVESQQEAGQRALAQLSTRSQRLHTSFVAPIQRVLFGINEKREQLGLEPIVSISPVRAKMELQESMEKFSKMKDILSVNLATSNEELQGLRKALQNTGQANTELRMLAGKTIASVWRNNAGFIITSEMMDSPVKPYGVTFSVSAKTFLKKTGWVGKEKEGGGSARLMFRVYNPAGGLIANCRNQKEAADAVKKAMEEYQAQLDSSRGK